MPGDTDNEVKIGIGDILVKASVPPSSVGLPNLGVSTELSAYASIIFRGHFEFDAQDKVLSIVIDRSPPEVHVEIEGVVRNPAVAALEDEFKTLITGLFGDGIEDIVEDIPLPSIPVGEIDGIPAGTKWVLDNGVVDQSSGYLRLLGTVGVVVD
jgi:hypothetical protein